MKDYYQILGVEKGATDAEIKKQYRKRAMAYHPDLNPDNPAAEAKFKDLAEAYGVLTDPVKKREYDRYKSTGFRQSKTNGGFQYSQDDILRDLFNDPRFKQLFQTILQDFQRGGVRADAKFFKQTLFGGKGLLLGGLAIFGSMAGRKITSKAGLAQLVGHPVVKNITRGVASLLSGSQKGSSTPQPEQTNGDLHYHISLSPQELFDGTWVQVMTGLQGETIRVKIPPHSSSGKILRIRQKGHQQNAVPRGDLFIHLE
ncbi:MAG: DnaJ domain-containing protein [Desulfobulbaceae bacterium]|nr:DnaJ domain-containing protein [Desulfobulbaceae bacterium]